MFFFPSSFAFLSSGLQKEKLNLNCELKQMSSSSKFQFMCLRDYPTYNTWFENLGKNQNTASLLMAPHMPSLQAALYNAAPPQLAASYLHSD